MRPVRIAHATDIHWFVPPTLAELGPKRVIGSLNLYALGRRHQFDVKVQRELVAHLLQTRPDLVLITGDLTAQALAAEFTMAREVLNPLLAEIPTLILPGNHDLYTPDSQRSFAFHRTFEAWTGRREPRGLIRATVGDVTVLGLDPNRPLLFGASGYVPDDQLAELADALASPDLGPGPIVLGIHYPPVDKRGAIYDRPSHGLLNARALIEVLAKAPRRPALIACGHVHHGFLAPLRLPDGAAIPVADCGSSGQAWQPLRGRAAATATYTLAADGTVSYERFLYDGTRFAPEPGGAFASGA
jgi:3',5'-cyclic AMP phosphodiesterase CpdA